MVNNQLGELLDRDVPFIAPDQGKKFRRTKREYCIACPLGRGAKSDEGTGNGMMI